MLSSASCGRSYQYLLVETVESMDGSGSYSLDGWVVLMGFVDLDLGLELELELLLWLHALNTLQRSTAYSS
jgi:hypothetical protein